MIKILTFIKNLSFIEKGVKAYEKWRKKRKRGRLLNLHDDIRDELHKNSN